MIGGPLREIEEAAAVGAGSPQGLQAAGESLVGGEDTGLQEVFVRLCVAGAGRLVQPVKTVQALREQLGEVRIAGILDKGPALEDDVLQDGVGERQALLCLLLLEGQDRLEVGGHILQERQIVLYIRFPLEGIFSQQDGELGLDAQGRA